MSFFIVTYVHPDEDGWNRHLAAHLEYLEKLLADGTLRASGPFVGTPEKSALLILTGDGHDQVRAVVEEDPFVAHGLVTELTITEWDPLFGTYQNESSHPRPA